MPQTACQHNRFVITGEIRDEGATGQGSKPKVGLCGFSVSNLKIDGAQQPWEVEYGKPSQIVFLMCCA
jgi:phosphoribosylformylglycinamidine synthase